MSWTNVAIAILLACVHAVPVAGYPSDARLREGFQCSEFQSAETRSQGVRITIDDSDSMQGFVTVDAARFHQVVDRLLGMNGAGATVVRLSDGSPVEDWSQLFDPQFYEVEKTSRIDKFFDQARCKFSVSGCNQRGSRTKASAPGVAPVQVFISDLQQYPRNVPFGAALDRLLAATNHVMIAAYRSPFKEKKCINCKHSERGFYIMAVAASDAALTQFARQRLGIDRDRHPEENARVFFATEPAVQVESIFELPNDKWNLSSSARFRCDDQVSQLFQLAAPQNAGPLYVKLRVRFNATIRRFDLAEELTRRLVLEKKGVFDTASVAIVDQAHVPRTLGDQEFIHLQYQIQPPMSGSVTYQIKYITNDCAVHAPRWVADWRELQTTSDDLYAIVERIVEKVTRTREVLTHYISVQGK